MVNAHSTRTAGASCRSLWNDDEPLSLVRELVHGSGVSMNQIAQRGALCQRFMFGS